MLTSESTTASGLPGTVGECLTESGRRMAARSYPGKREIRDRPSVAQRHAPTQCRVAYVDHAARGLRLWSMMVAGRVWRMLAGSPGGPPGVFRTLIFRFSTLLGAVQTKALQLRWG